MSHGVPSWKEMMYGFVDDPRDGEGVPYALDIRDGQLDGQEEVPLEAQEETRLEEGRRVIPQEGGPLYPPVLLW